MSINLANKNRFSEGFQKPDQVLQVAYLRNYKPSTTRLPQINIIPIAVLFPVYNYINSSGQLLTSATFSVFYLLVNFCSLHVIYQKKSGNLIFFGIWVHAKLLWLTVTNGNASKIFQENDFLHTWTAEFTTYLMYCVHVYTCCVWYEPLQTVCMWMHVFVCRSHKSNCLGLCVYNLCLSPYILLNDPIDRKCGSLGSLRSCIWFITLRHPREDLQLILFLFDPNSWMVWYKRD